MSTQNMVDFNSSRDYACLKLFKLPYNTKQPAVFKTIDLWSNNKTSAR